MQTCQIEGKRHMHTIIRVIFLASLGALLMPAAAGALEPAQIHEWTVPWEQSRPRDPDVAPDGAIWFVGQRSDYVGHFDPASERFEKFDLPDGSGPHNVIVTRHDEIWFTGNRAAYIGRLDPDDGSVHRVPMPHERARDPHTLVEAPNGDLWFTVQGGNFIGHRARQTETVTLIDVPTAGARPYGIVVTPEGRPWATLFGANKLATVDPDTMELTEIELPREDARPRRIARTDDGMLWYVDYARGYLGCYDPEQGSFEEWRSPSGGEARPYGLVSDAKGRLWYVETGPSPNLFVGFDPATESFSKTPIPSGAGAVRHMAFDAERDGVWFGTDANTLGRADLP